MIDVNDLMCGNWVNDTVLGKVIVLNNLPYSMDLSHSEGIPVTVNMLRRIGFKAHKGICPKTFYRYWDKEHRYKLDVDEGYTNSGRKWSIHIDNDVCNTIGSGEFTYVHELQNLVRVITGQKLPITKEMLQ